MHGELGNIGVYADKTRVGELQIWQRFCVISNFDTYDVDTQKGNGVLTRQRYLDQIELCFCVFAKSNGK